MQKMGDFKLPQFFNYPPYFTLQPVRDTREKQVNLWKELIVDYCRMQKIFVIDIEENFPLFANPVIERSLNHEASEAFLAALVSEGFQDFVNSCSKLSVKGCRKLLILSHQFENSLVVQNGWIKDIRNASFYGTVSRQCLSEFNSSSHLPCT